MTTVTTRSSLPFSRRRTGGWLVAAFPFAFAVWYAVCFGLALARAREFAGHWYIPSMNDEYTATADIWAGWRMSWLVAYSISWAPLLAGFTLFVTGMLFILGYQSGHRRLSIALIGGAVMSLLILVVAVTPAAQSVSVWLLD
ncbi:hypothetical protein ACQP2E_21545 [Actinoplanes sp. CA-015351]|uniref:hypothetical protein n=1 Tax=Actinoplanes sp. CA-015351 TaxID=3239897 RepID=UPI003D976D71